MDIPFDKDDLIQLAEVISCGWVCLPYGTTYLYTADEWRDAAEKALEGDFEDMACMDWRESQVDAFFDWMHRDPKNREDVQFDDWLEGREYDD